MTQRTFNTVAGLIFAVVAVLHGMRLLLGWDAVIGGWEVPHWVSWIALALAGYLGYTAFAMKTH